jgi:flagellar protein FlaF
MAGASLVGSAVGIILLIVTAYVLVSGAITVSQVTVGAQKEMTGVQERILGTSLSVTYFSSAGTSPVTLVLNNTGREVIGPFNRMDVYVYDATSGLTRYQYNLAGGAGTWRNETPIVPDIINPRMWDPGERLNITIEPETGASPVWVRVTTQNGVSVSGYL